MALARSFVWACMAANRERRCEEVHRPSFRGCTPLPRYKQARTALAECHRVDEVKDIRDKAEAMAAYARQAKDSELIQYATEIKVRAERRCGELLTKADKNTGARGVGSNQHQVRSHDSTAPTLASMGLSRDESSRYQQLAAMPADHFETAVATANATTGEVATTFMLREAERPCLASREAVHRLLMRPPPMRQRRHTRSSAVCTSESGACRQPQRARCEACYGACTAQQNGRLSFAPRPLQKWLRRGASGIPRW